MNTSEIFLIAMVMIFGVPYLIWRVGRTDYYAPLVVVQILTGIVLGAVFPDYYQTVFTPLVIQSLNGIAWWAVMLFVMIAGIELDLKKVWEHRRESGITAACALSVPLVFGSLVALGLLTLDGRVGSKALSWQFVLGIGMACAVMALPILILLMEKLDILRQPIGQRILRYASLDDIAIWGVLAIILLDWTRVGRPLAFLILFALGTLAFRRLMRALSQADRWYVCLIWLAVCGFAADWAGLHFMVGVFLAGASVFIAAGALLIAAVVGKLAGLHLAGKILKWENGEASIIGWLLKTKALIMIIFVNILLDKAIITNEAFTALLLMAVASTMLTVPVVAPKLKRLGAIISRVR